MKVSFFLADKYSKKTKKYVPNVIPNKDLDFLEYLEGVKLGEFQDEVLHFRAGRIDKTNLPGVTPSGTFSYRRIKDLKEHSGILVVDIDKDVQYEEYNHGKVRLKLKSDPYIYAYHLSCSGDGGIAAYVKINPSKHLESFYALEKYFAEKYHIIIDPSGKDVSRLRFVSYDPDLYVNTKSKKWTQYLPKTKQEPRNHSYIFTDDDLSHVFDQIKNRRIDLTFEYHDWFRVACAISDHYGAAGIEYFHLVSSMSEKYDQKACDRLYKILIKRKNSGIKIGTFLWMAKQAGVEIQSPKTKMIVQVASNRKRQIGKSGGAKNTEDAQKSAIRYLAEQENIGGKEVEELVKEIIESKHNYEEETDLLQQVRIFLNGKNIRFNEVTNQSEIDGEPMTDRLFNTLYIEAMETISQKVTKDMLLSFVESKETKAYHPFKEYFESIKHLKPTGHIKKLTECIDGKNPQYIEIFVKKWLLSIVASAHGTYSLMILVLTGGQRTGKTEFFRKLLPKELRRYYAESKLDEGKDAEILMTQKLLIVDDEFSGKSKRDYKKLKEMSSKQFVNNRRVYAKFHEDIRRYAVLAGTSNEDEVINDPTGNRRIIPLNIVSIDHEAMDKIDRDELWAELYHEWKDTGNGWMLDYDDIQMLSENSALNVSTSVEQELINKYFEPCERTDVQAQFLTATDIKVFLEERAPTVRLQPYLIGAPMKALGFEKMKKRINGEKNPSRVYVVKERPQIGGGYSEPYHDDDIPF